MNEPYAEINLSALKNNAKILKKACAPALFYAVVKANAYGHGLIQTSRAIQTETDGFCAGTVAEGAALRLSGIQKPILCLIPPAYGELYRAQAYELEICVQSLSALKALAKFSALTRLKTPIKFHLAVNTGMNRLGVAPCEIGEAIKIIKEAKLVIVGAFSHFYNAQNYRAARAQYNAFCAANLLKNEFGGIKLHISSGAGLAYGNEFKLDIVRVGLALYGYCYEGICGELFSGLTSALKIYAPILQTRRVTQGDSLLYGDYVCSRNRKINVLSYGYYHGLSKKIKGGLNLPCMNISAASCFSLKNGIACVMDDALATAKEEGVSVYNVLTRASSLKKAYINHINCKN